MPKRPHIEKAEMGQWFPEKEEQRKPTPVDYAYPPHSYRIKPETHAKLKEIAKQNGLGLSDLVRYVFREFVRAYEANEVQLPIVEYVTHTAKLTD